MHICTIFSFVVCISAVATDDIRHPRVGVVGAGGICIKRCLDHGETSQVLEEPLQAIFSLNSCLELR